MRTGIGLWGLCLTTLFFLFLTGCATVIYPSPYADRGEQILYKYSYNMVQCDYCKDKTIIYKIANGKKIMCNNCYREVRKKIFKLK